MRNWLILFACMAMMCSCSAKKPRPIEVVGLAKMQQRVIEATGIGMPAKSAVTFKAMRKSSYKQARSMAEGQLETIIMGLQSAAGPFLKDILGRDEKKLRLVRKLIQKSQMTRKEWTNDYGCVVTLRLDKSKIENRLSIRLK